jgi:hypothetical protein
MTPEEYSKKKAARAALQDEPRATQLAIDMDALFALEEQHGEGRIYRHDLPAYVPGLPTMAVVRTPAPVEYKRFRDTMRRAKSDVEKGTAVDVLVSPCIVYPDAPTFDKLLAAFPGLGDSLAQPVMRLAEGGKQEQGKG